MPISTKFKYIFFDKYLAYLLFSKTFSLRLLILFTRRNVAKLLKVSLKTSFKNRYDTAERKAIWVEIQKMSNLGVSYGNLHLIRPLPLIIKDANYNESHIKIRLASVTIGFNELFNKTNYVDPEDIFAQSRFIWLLEIYKNYPSKNILAECRNKILTWIRINPKPNNSPEFESYSISERLIAWVFFMHFTVNKISFSHKQYQTICDSISIQLNHLLLHLEYKGKSTNNHILNNVRALYIVGLVGGIKEIVTLAKRIFTLEINNIIDNNGVYLEESSHYQFLLTKNLFEQSIFAYYYDDGEFRDKLRIIVQKMIGYGKNLQSCYEANEYPLIGDISPDLDPSWLNGYPFSSIKNEKSPWFTIFQKCIPPVLKLNESISHIVNPINTLLKYDKFEIWVITRNEKVGCHGHNDNGSIVVFHKGRPLLVDPGSFSYRFRESDIFFSDSYSHNFPIINSFPADLPKHKVYSSLNVSSKMSVERRSETEFVYCIIFSNKTISCTRRISYQESCLTINDQVVSKKLTNKYLCRWILNYEPKRISNNEFLCNGAKIQVISPLKSSYRLVPHKRCIAYGKSTKAWMLEITTQLVQPSTVTLNISLSNE